MPLKQKAGYIQHTKPTNIQINKSSVQLNKTNSEALQYWINELSAKDPATTSLYLRSFDKFLQYTEKTADELLAQRQQDQINPDHKIQRRMESILNSFIGKKRADGLATATLQIYFAAVRSFFEIQYYPLIMRKGDYPKGESLGVRVATKEAILKACESKRNRTQKLTKAVILFLKDSGLRESDTILLNYGKIARGLEENWDFIPITLVTEKQHTIAKTFIGEEAIQAINEYLKERRTGTEAIPPEIISDNSPLFVTQTAKRRRLNRSSFANIPRNAFLRVDEANISAHSLRKFVQTNLEAGNVNVNWIDQILGHKLVNSRDAYSKPTDEQLKDAYTKAYDHLRIYPKINKSTLGAVELKQAMPTFAKQNSEETFPVAEARNITEVKQLLATGYKYEMDYGGVKLFTKKA